MDKDLEEILFQKLRENPLDFNTLNKLGYIYLHSNNLLKSEEFYVRSIKTDSKQFEPYVSLGLIYTITLRLGKALYYLLKAMDENSESPELLKSIEEINSAILNKYSNLSDEKFDELANDGLKMLESGNNEEAIENYLILSKLLPDNEPALVNLCISLIRNQDYKIAEIILDDYISKKSSSGLINHYAGIVANFMGKFDKAEMYLTKSLELKPSLADIVSNGKNGYYKKEYDETELIKCPICSSENYQVVNVINQSEMSFNFNIINPLRIWNQCNDCKVVYAGIRPSEDALRKYSLEFFLNTSKLSGNDVEKIMLESNSFNGKLNQIEKLIDGEKLLDINSDYGLFLSTASSRGWNSFGIEDNPIKSKMVRETYNLNVENISLKNFETDKKFDLITLWESIEKTSDLSGLLNKIHSLLSDKGVFALSFHGKDTYISKNLGKSYPVWSYPDYLYFFDVDLMVKLLEKHGFKVIKRQVILRKYLGNVELYCQKA